MKVEPECEDEGRFGEALDALLRQLALMIVRDGEGAKPHRPRRRDGRRTRTPAELAARGGRQLAAGQGRAARRRPELGPHRPGRRRRAARQPRRCRSTSRSRASPCASQGAAVRHDAQRAGRRGRRPRGRLPRRAARRGRRRRGLLLRPQPRVRDHQRGLHDYERTSGHSSRRSRTSGSSTAAPSSSSTAARR